MDRLRWVLGALALVLVIAAGFLLAGRFAPRTQPGLLPTATITPTSASVAAFAGAAFACPHAPVGSVCNTPASLGQPVFVGGEVRTGESGTADVQTHTTVFRLGNGTQVRFRDVSDAVTQVVLAVGRLFASHDPGGRSVVRVQSGEVTIQAIDTRFTVETAATGGIYVAVPADGGQVTILAGAKTSMVLSAGQEVFISAGTTNTLPAPQPLNPAEQARWDAVSCAWQQIADRLTPVALPPVRCATPTATPTKTPSATPPPPTATPVPAAPTDTPVPPTATAEPPTLVPGAPTPTPPPTVLPEQTLPAYLGTWLNTDPRAIDPPKLTITNKARTLIVQWYKVCATHLCAVSTTAAPFTGSPFAVLSPDKHKMRLTLEKAGTMLRLDDGDSGAQFTFRRVAARDYNGIWLNDDAEDQTLRRIVVGNSSNKITVDWSSGCFVAPCTSTGPFTSEPIATDRYALSFDNAAGTRLQVDDLVQSITYFFHK